MTAEELLAAMAEPLAEDGTYCTIDPETRVITIPPEYQLLGVESDEKAERLYFKCPKIVGDNIDLTKLALRVNFRNAGAVVDQYLVDDVEVDGDDITFSWLLSRRVTQYEGTVSFIVCAVKVLGEEITNEWNTTLAEAEVLEGLEVEVVLPEDETDIVNQLLALAETRLNDVRDATSAANTAASNANQKAQEAENAAEDARGVIEQITKDSYLHTALQSFIDTVTATPTAYGNAVVKKIEGFTRQQTTTGAQLFDAFDVKAANGATNVKALNGGKDVQVTGKKGESSIDYAYYTIPASLVDRKTIYVYGEYSGNAIFSMSIKKSDNTWLSPNIPTRTWTKIDIPQGILQASVVLYPNGITATNETAIFKNIKVGFSQFETWEPYTGRQPAPNPDYLMVVQGNGKYGFWDGKFENGSYNAATGNPESGTNYIRCLNDIVYPLKSGDKIKFIYEKPVNIGIFLFDKQGVLTYASSSKFAEWEYTVTKDQERFRFFILDRDGVNAETAKHLTITINGKYALCIKSEGINLCSGVEVGAYLHTNGLPTADGGYRRTKRMLVKPSTTYKESCNTNSTLTKTVLFYDEKLNFIKYQPLTGTIQTPDNCAYMAINYYSGGSEPDVRDVIITESAKFPEEFIPYQGDVTYIPVDYPLFEGDKIIQRNGEYKLIRKYGVMKVDGSVAWSKNVPGDSEDYMYYYNDVTSGLDKNTSGKLFSEKFSQIETTEKDKIGVAMSYMYPKALYIRVNAKILPSNDADHFNQWIIDNPFTIVYPLAVPTEEDLSPESQKALHSIMATDEQTELTIVGVPADVGIQNQFLLPRNEDGALNTTAYCTAEKNKIVLNELVAQNLDARVNKLEIDNATLAEQTIIVE